ncbi:Protein CBG22138 [Caenorhabditis briggsae]|uniref:Protein CBG22138 n=1 Tax=Caenorhabditis briggsae TaxID=6238 RepID=A8Y1M1_CAEBR|nr:Protein CBG22138 [Caenorhabditis briggsae]CAP38791.2 Protein CBG22138 [Caenorhabditis briggsae]
MSWQMLTVPNHQKIVQLLDYESRCNIRQCSKDDRDVVDSTKLRFEKFRISEKLSKWVQEKTTIRVEIDSFTIWLTGKEDLTKIDRGWKGEPIEELSEIKHENRFEILQKLLPRFSRNGVIEADTVEIDEINFAPPESSKFKCSNLKLHSISNPFAVEWLKKTTEVSGSLKKLDVRCWGQDEQLWPEIAGINVSESLLSELNTNCNDEQLENLKAMNLKITASAVTVDGAMRKLEKFLKYGKKSDRLELSIEPPREFQLAGLSIPRYLEIKMLKKPDEISFVAKILGGFENVHGILDPRKIEIQLNWGFFQIICFVYEGEEKPQPCRLYPF